MNNFPHLFTWLKTVRTAVHVLLPSTLFTWLKTVHGCSWTTSFHFVYLAENCTWLFVNNFLPLCLPGWKLYMAVHEQLPFTLFTWLKLYIAVHEQLPSTLFTWLKTVHGCSWTTSFHFVYLAENCTWLFMNNFLPLCLPGMKGRGESLLVRTPDWWLKGCEFKSQQERRGNFLLQS